MTVYIIAQINITDRETYGKYEARFMDVFNRHGGQLLSVEEHPHTIEGEWPYTRTVLVSFPTREQAMAWYECSEYQALTAYRHAASTSNVALLEGFPAYSR